MREFEIRIKSVRDVLVFVNLATKCPFPVKVSNGRHTVNGKSFMEMVCMNFSRSAKAVVECSEEEYVQFRQEVQSVLAK